MFDNKSKAAVDVSWGERTLISSPHNVFTNRLDSLHTICRKYVLNHVMCLNLPC